MNTILVIEENPEMLGYLSKILELSGYQVRTSLSGHTGIEQARVEHPDLIICDSELSELDGYGVLHLLHRDPLTAGIPFIFLTSKTEKADIQKAMALGADGYLIKPFDDLSLLEMVEIRLQKTAFLKNEYKKEAKELNELLQTARGMNDLNRFLSEDRKILHIRKKQLIYVEGDYPGMAYFIQKGKVKTFKTNADGREYITDIYKEGDFFGYTEIVEDCNYRESASTIEDTELHTIQRQDFNDLLYRHYDVSHKFIKILANEIMEREERLLQLAYNSVRKRVADSLILLHERFNNNDTKPLCELSVGRDDLSNLAGASKETVIRTLSDFKQEKLIDINDRGMIRFLNLEKLRSLRN